MEVVLSKRKGSEREKPRITEEVKRKNKNARISHAHITVRTHSSVVNQRKPSLNINKPTPLKFLHGRIDAVLRVYVELEELDAPVVLFREGLELGSGGGVAGGGDDLGRGGGT
jgi:hypothetical protein